jgi:hypothetical protein
VRSEFSTFRRAIFAFLRVAEHVTPPEPHTTQSNGFLPEAQVNEMNVQ